MHPYIYIIGKSCSPRKQIVSNFEPYAGDILMQMFGKQINAYLPHESLGQTLRLKVLVEPIQSISIFPPSLIPYIHASHTKRHVFVVRAFDV